MARATIPVDLQNPGQVLACLGLMEAVDVLLGDTTGAFEWDGPDARFHISATGDASPIEAVLAFLAEAHVCSLAPAGSDLATDKWQVDTEESDGNAFPYARPQSPATLPALLRTPDGRRIVLTHWADTTKRDSVKFWTGPGGYPGAALVRDALGLLRGRLEQAAADPFAVAAPQSSAFRLDWRRDYVPIDVGFSPNDHTSVVMVGFPLVELLAAIGLEHARPKRIDKLHYRYSVVGLAEPDRSLIPLALHRVALGGVDLPFPQRSFGMQLGWPGKEGQARCILEVTEETRP